MVVKKKAMKVEAVALDEENLCKLIGKISTISMLQLSRICTHFVLYPPHYEASLSVDGGADGVRHLAQTLQACLKLTDPVLQIQLIKKACTWREL